MPWNLSDLAKYFTGQQWFEFVHRNGGMVLPAREGA